MRKIIFFACAMLGICITYYYKTSRTCTLVWSETVDASTIEDSWLTYNEYFAPESTNRLFPYKSAVPFTKEEFLQRLKLGSYSTVSIDEFLNLPIENHRLHAYKNSETAEQAYPLSNRPRANKDIESVNYFLKQCPTVSPITVALIIDKEGKQHSIKLDGVHRLIAANILKQKIRVLWIDLTTKPSLSNELKHAASTQL